MYINTPQNLAGAIPRGCSLTVHYVPDLLNDILDISRPYNLTTTVLRNTSDVEL